MPATPASVVFGRAAALGAATGLRSAVALAALTVRRSEGLPAVVRHQAARPAAALGSGFELVVDKLPGTPSRLEPQGVISRLIAAGLAGAVLARAEHRHPVPVVVIAATAALAATRIGHDARAALARHLPDTAVAVGEDALAIGLAVIGSS